MCFYACLIFLPAEKRLLGAQLSMDSISHCHVTLSLTPVFSSKILIPPKEMVKKIFCLCSPLERAPATTPCWKEEHGFYFSVFIWKFPLVLRHVRHHQLEPPIIHTLPLLSCRSLYHILTPALCVRIILLFAVLSWSKYTPDHPSFFVLHYLTQSWVDCVGFYIECGFNLLSKGKSLTIVSNKDYSFILLEIFLYEWM